MTSTELYWKRLTGTDTGADYAAWALPYLYERDDLSIEMKILAGHPNLENPERERLFKEAVEHLGEPYEREKHEICRAWEEMLISEYRQGRATAAIDLMKRGCKAWVESA